MDSDTGPAGVTWRGARARDRFSMDMCRGRGDGSTCMDDAKGESGNAQCLALCMAHRGRSGNFG